jgi:hypothetical protein
MFSADWALAMYAFFGKYPDAQQQEIIDSVDGIASRTSVKSGHGTGKSDLASMMLMLFMIFNPDSKAVVIAAKISVVKEAIWSNMFTNFDQLKIRMPWVAHYFELTDTAFYEKSKKPTWKIICKGYRINNEQSLAGEHRDRMLTILDEASIITDAAFNVVLGSTTSKDNRMLMMSQPTKVGGFFYETHNGLSKKEGGKWTSITLRSDLSEWVQPDFIVNALSDYGGYDSPEYQIKVLGAFPQKMSEFLLGRAECQAAVGREIALDDDWGWIATCDVGITRDRSVINICKNSGAIGPQRKSDNHSLLEMPANVTPVIFADRIIAHCCTGSFPNITIGIDADGIGFAVWELVVKAVEEGGYDDVTVVPIHWGKPPFTNRQKLRFKNLRAMAHIYATDAISDGRSSLDAGHKTVNQFSKLPCIINGAGQWVMMPKIEMKRKYSLSSPDRSDTYCFQQMINYVPAGRENIATSGEMDMMNKFLAETKGVVDDIYDGQGDGWDSAFETLDSTKTTADYRDFDRDPDDN